MHVFNAQSDGNKVTLLAPFYNGNFFPFFPNVDGSPWDPSKAQGFVRQYTFDLGSSDDSWREETLFDTPIVDLGKIDHRFMTLPQRYAFTTFADPGKPFDRERAGEVGRAPVNSYARFDLEDGVMRSFFAGDTYSLQELTFVPRRGSSEEGDGYLIGTASDLAEMRTELIVVDAQRLEEIARVYLPFRASTQVHGYWWDAEELGLTEEEAAA
jgi:carotenoid cleavage dioxygenase